MEAKQHVEGSSGNEFPLIYSHCGVMAAWSRKTWKKFFRLFWKTTPYGKIFEIMFRDEISRQRSTCSVKIPWNVADGKSVKSCFAYLTKNFAWLSSSRYCADRARNLPGPAQDNVLRVLWISSKSVHFRPSYIRTREHRQSAIQILMWIQYSAEAISSSWIKTTECDKKY